MRKFLVKIYLKIKNSPIGSILACTNNLCIDTSILTNPENKVEILFIEEGTQKGDKI